MKGFNEADDAKRKRIREDDIALQEAADLRENSLFKLALNKQAGVNSSKNSGKAEKAAQASQMLKMRVSQADDVDEETKLFFNTISDADPYASLDVLNFIDSQAKDFSRDLSFSEVRSLINVMKLDVPEQKKIDFISVITDSDFKGEAGKKQFYKIAEQINSFTGVSGRSVFIDPQSRTQIDEGNRLKLQNQKLDEVYAFVTEKAINAINSDGYTGDPVSINAALKDIENSNPTIRARGETILRNEFLTYEDIIDLEKNDPISMQGLSEIPVIKRHLLKQRPFVSLEVFIEELKKQPGNENFTDQELEDEYYDTYPNVERPQT